MYASLVDGHGHLVWTSVPDPILRPGDILIEVRAVGVRYPTLPITEAAAGHAILQNRENLGKVVLTVNGEAP